MSRRYRIALIVSIVVLVAEWSALARSRDGVFTIFGRESYALSEFGRGQPVAHAFLMRGDGFHAVELRFVSRAAATIRVRWTLSRGYADDPATISKGFEGTYTIELRPGPQWKAFSFTRDGSSNERWFTIELQRLDPAEDDGVAVTA